MIPSTSMDTVTGLLTENWVILFIRLFYTFKGTNRSRFSFKRQFAYQLVLFNSILLLFTIGYPSPEPLGRAKAVTAKPPAAER